MVFLLFCVGMKYGCTCIIFQLTYSSSSNTGIWRQITHVNWSIVIRLYTKWNGGTRDLDKIGLLNSAPKTIVHKNDCTCLWITLLNACMFFSELSHNLCWSRSLPPNNHIDVYLSMIYVSSGMFFLILLSEILSLSSIWIYSWRKMAIFRFCRDSVQNSNTWYAIQGLYSFQRHRLPYIGIPIITLRRSDHRLRYIHVTWNLYTNKAVSSQ